MIFVDIRRLRPNARLPEKATTRSAGWDVRACIDTPVVLLPGEQRLVPLGFAMTMPDGWCALLKGRSGNSLKRRVDTHLGAIDGDYPDEVGVVIYNDGNHAFTISDGDRIAQMLFVQVPDVLFREAEQLPDTGSTRRGGFGSTGTT